MKKLIFISLLIIPFCKAADNADENWYRAVQNIPNWRKERTLDLPYAQIQAIPADLIFPNLKMLLLDHNQINQVHATRLLKQFPKLKVLDLSSNPLHPADIENLRRAARAIGRPITIIANDILPEDRNIKG